MVFRATRSISRFEEPAPVAPRPGFARRGSMGARRLSLGSQHGIIRPVADSGERARSGTWGVARCGARYRPGDPMLPTWSPFPRRIERSARPPSPARCRSRVPPSSVAGSARGRGHRRAVVRRDEPHAAPLLRPTPPRGFARPDALAAGRSRGSAWVARGGPTVRWVAPSSGASCDGGRGTREGKRAGDGGRGERSIRRGNGDQSMLRAQGEPSRADRSTSGEPWERCDRRGFLEPRNAPHLTTRSLRRSFQRGFAQFVARGEGSTHERQRARDGGSPLPAQHHAMKRP